MAGVIQNMMEATKPAPHPLDAIENAALALGLTSPIARAGAGFLAVMAAQSALKELSPGAVSYAYDSYGNRRPWAFLTEEGDNNATYFPWWVVPGIAGAVFGLFV